MYFSGSLYKEQFDLHVLEIKVNFNKNWKNMRITEYLVAIIGKFSNKNS